MYDLEQKVHIRVKECVEKLDMGLELTLTEGLESIHRTGQDPLRTRVGLKREELQKIVDALLAEGFKWADPENTGIYRNDMTDELSAYLELELDSEIHKVEIYSRSGAVIVEVGDDKYWTP